MFSEKDYQQIQSKGLTNHDIEMQLENFRRGFPFLSLIRPATIVDGIHKLDQVELKNLGIAFDQIDRSKLKFVPASGAASRMFKSLLEFLQKGNDSNIQEYPEVLSFFNEIQSFGFYDELKAIIARKDNCLDQLLENKQYQNVLECLLHDDGLGYSNLPKGLLKFHKYEDSSRTPFEEHLVEGKEYAKSIRNEVKVHFTISPEHAENFKNLESEKLTEYENRFNVSFQIDYSVQKPSTDMVAVDMNNNLLRDMDGKIIFRPGGHGALLDNLNELNADIIFIKNIDNIAPDRLKSDTIAFKKALGGLLHTLQSSIFSYLYKLDVPAFKEDYPFNEIETFITERLGITIHNDYNNWEFIQKKLYLHNLLNRPIRICGMVKNEGEPGGGPFWVVDENGRQSLQIVETSQIDLNNTKQIEILNRSTHFNPVDLVCGIKNYRGEKFDLFEYRDMNTGFISRKSKDGIELKAQELPGLWNGAMADWITVFVEVPLSTFSPVKIVNDLLRNEHQC